MFASSATPAHSEFEACNYRLCPDFCFSDGNIVLVAQTTAFRVHQGHLSRHSAFFKGLFNLPQNLINPTNLLFGCPSVELFDDPTDVYFLLKAIYDGLHFRNPFPKDFPFLAGVLRLSTKYVLDTFRDICIARLQRDYPPTLVGWDQRERAATEYHPSGTNTTRGRYMPRDVIPSPIAVINLARELGIESLLPAAFYDLARYSPSKTAIGIPKPTFRDESPPSPTLTSSSTSSDSEDGHRKTHPNHIFVSNADLITTFQGRESAQRSIASFLARELADRVPTPGICTATVHKHRQHETASAATTRCAESFYFIHLNVLRSIGGIAAGRDADPLFTLRQAKDMLHRTDFSDLSGSGKVQGLRMCVGCKREFGEVVERAREEMWKEVPGWFGFERGWEGLWGASGEERERVERWCI